MIKTLGSLFDGSGGFPLAGLMCGIKPVWASEIEPFPIRVTTKRLPFMKHYGDINKMNGADIEPVDIITFGSPCTDISVAGKRAGIGGKQSSLFYQAIRIIKEMREITNGKYPRYILWENVPGAFSSGKGADFQCVLEEICKIKNEIFSVPQPEKWSNAGEILGDNFSLAWRVLDSQYWGVPQSRKRIYLVADFRGERAGEILFREESMLRDIKKVKNERERIAEEIRGSINKTSQFTQLNYSSYKESNISCTLKHSGGSYGGGSETLIIDNNIIRKLTPIECCRLQGFPDKWCKNLEEDNPSEEDINFFKKVFLINNKNKSRNQIIKWLKNPHSDSAEYKMWGNGIALPNAFFILYNISNQLNEL